MFGFGKRKSSEADKPSASARRSAESRERKSQNLAQLGFLAGVTDDGDIDNLMGNMDVGDDDLEEELALILEGKQPAARRPKMSPPRKPSSAAPQGKTRPSSKPFNMEDNEEDNDDDDDDIDLDDPDLEAELGDILGLESPSKSAKSVTTADDNPPQASSISSDQLCNLLETRLKLYQDAKAASDSVGDSSKSRRFLRGIKTLQELLSKAKAGRVVDEQDIPPIVAIGTIKKETPISSLPPSTSQTPPSSEISPITPVSDFLVPSPEEGEVSVPTPPPRNQPPKLPEPLIPTPASAPPPVPQRPVAPPPVPQRPVPVAPPPTQVEEQPPIPLEKMILVDPQVEVRMKEYKLAAVALKRQGDVQAALQYLKLSKFLENSIKSGEPINLSDYPPIPTEPLSSQPSSLNPPHSEEPPFQQSQPPPEEPAPPQPQENTLSDDIFGAPPPPKSISEALEQRLTKYKSEVEKATESSNSSKARRMGRIVKQYEEAITAYKKGKPVPFDELPTPPGFAPIPVPGTGGGVPVPASVPPQSIPAAAVVSIQPEVPQPGGVGGITPPKTSGTSPGGTGTSPGSSSGSMVNRSGKQAAGKLTLQEKQLQAIILRQQQFKEAALNAKKRGDLNQAREFLRTAKGFDKLIQVSQAGLPVDMNTLPSAPEAVATLDQVEDDNFEVVSASDCIMPSSGNAAEIFGKLEGDLKQQLKMCMRTRDHFKSFGDVASANRFEGMALESKRDLDALRLAMKKNTDIPKYHYENRIFSITECNTDVGEDEIEISIVQGINYKVSNPQDVDTFVKIELPYPSAEELQTNKTGVVKDTNNPQYNATFKMSINRTARNFQRFVHRHGFKCEVWSRGGLCSGGFFFCQCNSGFLRGNTLIGTASVKILPLETKCTLHDAFDILDGRKVVGKLEVKIRIREPVLTKQITQKKEKWLSIDRA